MHMPAAVVPVSGTRRAVSAGRKLRAGGKVTPYYDDGQCVIYHGDCFDVLHSLGGIGAVVTDPPYSSGGAFRGDRAQQTTTKYVNSDTMAYRPEFAGDNRDQRSFLAWSTMWLNAARQASVPGAVLASFIDWRQLPVLSDSVQAGGWTWRGLGTWWKPGCRMQKGRFSASAEYVIYATNGPATDGKGSPQNVFPCKIDGDRDHIAQKPEDVMRWVLQLVPEGAIVLDPFMGSGSTLRAALDTGHRAIGIEVDERYCAIAAERLSQRPLFGTGVGISDEPTSSGGLFSEETL
jgi:site-specific DNA-methyltransferase (adenine-specific)